MEWLEKVLETLVEDKAKRDEAIASIKKELGLQFVPKSTFNEVNNELKAAKEHATSQEASIKELTSKAATAEEKEALIKKMETEHATFKADTDKRIANTQKMSALQLSLAGEVDKSAIDLIAGLVDLDKLELKDGKLSNYDDIIKPIREERKTLFIEKKVEGQPPSGGGGSPEGGQVVSDAEYYAKLNTPKLT